MQSVRYVLMETILTIILLFSAACVISACIKDVLDLQKYLLKAGSAMSVYLLDHLVSTYLVLCAMLKEEQ